jgi:capsular exopolysaccharide synthesis family protein
VVARDRDFINALCEEFLEANLEEKNEEATRTIDFINEQLGFISDSLRTSENRLRQYRRENNMVDVNGYTSTVLSKLSALDAHRSELTLKEAYFAELAEYLTESVLEERLVAPSSIGVSDPVLLDLVSKFNELQQKRSDLGEKNPNYERYSKRMDEVRSTMLEVLENVRRVHDMERVAFEKEYRSVMDDLQDLPEKELMMINYERAYKINDNYYTFLLQKQSEAQIRKASNVPDNKILQKARISQLPVNGGDKIKIYLLFVIIGLLIPSAYIILKELLNTTIRGERDVMKITNIPVLGTIRHADDSEAKVQTVEKPKSLFTEGFRIIRSRVEFIVKRKTDISVLITSAESGDGKTFFALNLSGVYSLVSDKMILLDMDIRNPRLTEKLGYKNNKGLVHVLIGEATLDEVIIKDFFPNLDILCCEKRASNPTQDLNSEEFLNMLQELRQRYDKVFVDSPPVGAVSDAVSIMPAVDGVIYIVKFNSAKRKTIKNYIKRMMESNIPVFGAIMNMVSSSASSVYSMNYYDKSYQNYYTNPPDLNEDSDESTEEES